MRAGGRCGPNVKESSVSQTQSYGQQAVGLKFNPGADGGVAQCKLEFAAVIDRMHQLREASHDPEVKRMASVAITEAQTAQMWAVKALTWGC